MLVSRVLAGICRSLSRSSLLLSHTQQQQFPILSNQFHSLVSDSKNKLVTGQLSLLHHLTLNSQKFGFSSSASPEANAKEQGSKIENNGGPKNAEPKKSNGASVSAEGGNTDHAEGKQTEESGSNIESQLDTPHSKRRRVKRTAFSDSDSDSDAEAELSVDDLKKLVIEKEKLLKMKHKEIEKMQDKVLRAYAEMENVMDRTKREAENSKKFAIQNFAKSLLDVADNLGRASSVVKESFSKIDASKDSSGAVPLLKTLLEGVEMTEKQLGEVFKKFGVEKFDPINEPFDPNRHMALFQVPDASKPSGTVAHVLKAGYMLYDRVLRPAEVGVAQGVERGAAEGVKDDVADKESPT